MAGVTAPVRLEVAFDVDPGVDPAAGDWTLLPGRLFDEGTSWSTDQTSGRGTLALDNRDRALDPQNGASPFDLRPMRHVRLTTVVGGTTIPLWRGYVEDWPPQWQLNLDTVTAPLVDARGWLARQEVTSERPLERTSARISGVLNAAGWPVGLRDIDTGIVFVQPLALDEASALRAVEDAVDAEDGWVFVAPDGRLTVRNRHHRFAAAAADTFTTTDHVAAVTPNRVRLVNIGRVERRDGSRFEKRDAASVDAHGPWVQTVRDLALSPQEADGLADWTVYRYAEPVRSLDQVAFTVASDEVLERLLQLRIGDLVLVQRPEPERAVLGHLTGVSAAPGLGVWRVSLALGPYFGAGPWLSLDDDTLGVLDGDNMLAP